MKYFVFFIILISITSCSIGANNSKSNSQKKEPTEEESYKVLLSLEKILVQYDLALNSEIADSLYQKSLTFIHLYPKSEHQESVLVIAAKCSDGLNLNQENISLIDQLLKAFPHSVYAPNYLYNKGKIYEEKLKDLPKAKKIYKELISKYPKSELGKSMVSYLNFLEKSDTEQLDFLKN
jgi:tetratricopeptide (TPR) repeat protein